MTIFLRVEPCAPEQSGKGLTFLDPIAMEENGLKEGQVVEILTHFGKSVLARIGETQDEDRQKGFVRLDQYMRQALKVFIGDVVEVEETTVGAVKQMVLAPLIDVSQIEGIEGYLAKTFASNGITVSKGAVVYATLPGATAGSAFKVLDSTPEQGVVTPETAIELRYVYSVWPGGSMEVTFEDVGGLSKEIRMVRELVELPLLFPDAFRQLGINPPRGIIFYGPPGAGKTHLARAIANEIKAQFLYINGPEIISSVYGETEANLRKTFEEASHHLPSMIFVDELDVIVPKRGESGSQSDTRMVTQFLELLDGLKRVEGVMVIGTTNRIDTIDKSVRRPGRFDREIFIGPPDEGGRMEILQIHTRGMPLSPEAMENLKEIAKQTHGFVGADMMELCREAGLNSIRRNIGGHWSSLSRVKVTMENLVVEKEDFQQALARVRPSAMRETVASVPDTTWNDIGGMEEVKERLRELIQKPLQHPETFASMKVNPPSGILLYGPPGTGKTLLAKAIAHECQANFLSIKGPEIFSKWLGESEESIRHVFQVARQVSPAILFFDQVDAIAPRRMGGSDSRAMERVVNQLLTEMDGIEPLTGLSVIAATNRLDLLDPAILRPGRFGAHIFVPMPDENDRRAILAVHLKGTPLHSDNGLENILDELVPRTDGFSGAEIESLCHEAKLRALRSADFQKTVPLTLDHFLTALDKVSTARATYAEAT